MKTYKIFIDGRWINSNTNKTFLSLNPANEQVLGMFQLCSHEDVDKAVNAAEKAYSEWNYLPAPKRGELLLEVAKLLKKDKNKLAKLVTLEMGKVYKEALGDVQEAIDIFEYMAGEGRRLFGITTPSELRNKHCMTVRTSIGVVGLITPWNFPIAIPAWKISGGLMCGNTKGG